MNAYEYMRVGENEKPLDRMVFDGGLCSIFRRIACIGDSLSSGELESVNEDGTKGYHDFYEYSWGQQIARSTGATVYNFSAGGMTADRFHTFAHANGFWRTEKLCQAYIIALGVNDLLNRGDEVGSVADIDREHPENNAKTFVGEYAKIIQRIQKLQPRAKIFLVSIPRYCETRARKEELKLAHRNALQSLTEYFENTYLIDLYEYAPVFDEAFVDNYIFGHMTPAGYVFMGRMIESYIDYIIRKNPKDFAWVGFIGTDLYYHK